MDFNNRGQEIKSGDGSYLDLVSTYLDSYSDPDTRRGKVTRMKYFQSFMEGKDFTIENLKAFTRFMYEKIHQNELSKNYVISIIDEPRIFLEKLFEWGYDPPLNWFEAKEALESPKRDRGITVEDVMTDETYRKFENACESPRERAFIKILGGTGARRKGILNLRPESFFTKETESGKQFFVTIKNTKLDGKRTIPISEEVYRSVERYLESQNREIGNADGRQLFVTRKGEMTKSGFQGLTERIRERFPGGEQYSAHNFRHTYATQHFRNGKSVVTVMKRLGHNQMNTTLRSYILVAKELEEGPTEDWWTV